MYIFAEDTLDHLYLRAVRAVLASGHDHRKGDGTIRELYPALFILSEPSQAILCVEGRPYSPAFMVAEMLWNLTGDTRDWLCRYNPRYRRYFTGRQLPAGYGNRMLNWSGCTNQIDKVVAMLRERPDTQHANVIIFDPAQDLDNPTFVPCITRIHFKVRQGRLEMSSYLRAQDLWLGFPYDVHFLLCLFQLVAARLSIQMGTYYHHCEVLRLYERDLRQAEALGTPMEPGLSRAVDLELGPEDAQGKLLGLRDALVAIAENPATGIPAGLLSGTGFWSDALHCCLAYQFIHRRTYHRASANLRSIRGILARQFLNWSAAYHPAFHQYHCGGQ